MQGAGLGSCVVLLMVSWLGAGGGGEVLPGRASEPHGKLARDLPAQRASRSNTCEILPP